MGSRTPEDHHRGPNESSGGATIASTNPPKQAAASGLLHGLLEGQDEDEDEDEDDGNGADLNSSDQPSTSSKRKRKRNKKKTKSSSTEKQTTPPRVALTDIFHDQPYPKGDIVEYAIKDENLERTTAQEIRHVSAMANMDDEFLSDYRQAAEIHRQVRQYVRTIAKPGVSMARLAQEIDDGVRALTGHPGIDKGDALKAGLAFPTGLCLNNVGAHWTPNTGAKDVILQYDDVLKIDFGVHVNGRIVDSAFTIAPNPIYSPLLDAVRAATNTGLAESGIDARISELSASMQEVMESYEVVVDNATVPVKAVRNITGHNILRYKIHGAKQVPFVRTKTSQRMDEGDIFAIETFGSTGRGVLHDADGVYGYGRAEGVSAKGVRSPSAKALLRTIEENFGTLVFAKRYVERLPGVKNLDLGMRDLVREGVVDVYKPLVDVKGSYIAQFEHTVLLRPGCKEVVSRGEDY